MKVLILFAILLNFSKSCDAENASINMRSSNQAYELIGDYDVSEPMVIKNLKDGKVEARIDLLSPVIFIEWLKNNESIVVVSHLAGGSMMSIVHRIEGKWKRVDFDPPEVNAGKYAVTNIEEKDGFIMVRYRVRYDGHEVGDYHYGTIEFKVNPAKDGVFEVVKKNISIEEFSKLKELSRK